MKEVIIEGEIIPFFLTKAELLKIFAQYPLNPIAIFDGDMPVQDKIEGVDFVSETVIAERTNYDPKLIKLILSPVSKMTSEDSLEIAETYFGEKSKGKILAFQGIELSNALTSNETEFTPSEYIELLDLVKSKQYATKTPFGKNHWAAKKTLFELGVAIEPISR
ncbi:MAG: hypothetical protein ABIP51_18305 [Bacteroidia bacterium]